MFSVLAPFLAPLLVTEPVPLREMGVDVVRRACARKLLGGQRRYGLAGSAAKEKYPPAAEICQAEGAG